MDNQKLVAVNQCLEIFAPGTTVRKGRTGWMVEWMSGGKIISRRWTTKGHGSHYPSWHYSWAHGGTCCQALCQLMRWLQGRSVFGIKTWEYWTGNSVYLGQDRGSEIIQILKTAGWPEDQVCVLCDREIDARTQGLDWWDLDGVSGPCCRSSWKCSNMSNSKLARHG